MSALLELPVVLPPRCIVCAGEASPKMTMPVDAKTFEPTAHGAVYACVDCAMGFVHPRPSVSQTASFYELDAYYTQGESHLVKVAPPGLLSRLRKHVAWMRDRGERLCDVITGELPPGSSLVDIGCGAGRLLGELAQRGYRVTGVERDASSLSRRNSSITVLEGSAESLPTALRAGTYDAVVFSHVVEHLVDPVGALVRACTLLKPGGLLFCEVPNNESAIAQQSGLAWEHLDIPRHLNFFTERSLMALMESAGLRACRVYFRGYLRYFEDSYIATEQRIYDRLAALPGPTGPAIRNSKARAWKLLARTAFASPRKKYDSVGIVARLEMPDTHR